MVEIKKFDEWLNERFLFGRKPQEEMPTLTVAPQMQQKEPNFRQALDMAFGRETPYRIDAIFLDALDQAIRSGSDSKIRAIMDQISSNRGFGTRNAVYNFITASGSNLDKIKSVQSHRRDAAKEFATGQPSADGMR